ncbi:MAG TPA: hypothetical protein PLX66_02505 [Bacilli bacterium]|nr:hypothetical protein [Bacilli bacterium]
MIKYFSELENPNNFTLPLVSYKGGIRTMYLKKDAFPPCFYEKYGKFLSYLDEIIEMAIYYGKKPDLILTESSFSCPDQINMEEYTRRGESEINLKEFCDNPEFLNKIITPNDIFPVISQCAGLLDILIFLYPNLAQKWTPILNGLSNACEEIEKYEEFKYRIPKVIPKNQKMANSWFITCYGDLYNTGNRHKQTNLTYIFDQIKKGIYSGGNFEGWSKSIWTIKEEIIAEGFVNYTTFYWYVKSGYWFPIIINSFDTYPDSSFRMEDLISNKYDEEIVKAVFSEVVLDYFGAKSFNKEIITVVLGVISAQAGLVNFFERFQRDVRNPRQELERLEEMTFFSMSDILVRCARFYKIESMLKRTITTSSITPFEDLQEYVKRGWNVYVIPPIIISKEEGVVKELDLSSPIVERELEKDVKRYERSKKEMYGYGTIHY